ncbi:MAG: chemotaxis protein CheA [Methylobacter sp.]|nr:chemotaxis protein CheA [Methylobacter sp.]MDP2427800.1 chemotaxis protein CheA [Methylobacter sp.]MDP3055013.1 chemotaxis protein CheA [Methylobacter sp.]MDP3362129.1 chemotaxis protein CheA [Methylobacter sp.]MDZ4219847.1 chemotaxis protein CheA [Methylobacter sp.]
MIPDEYLQSFVIECRELLEAMEEALLIVEQAAEDPEIINAIFRAAHTIKGSAGMFGLDPIVAFTHAAESVLDQVRSGDIAMTSALAALFIEAHDHLILLIGHVADGSEPSGETDTHGQALIKQLEAYLGGAAVAEPSADMPTIHQSTVEREESDAVGTDHWHISLRFGTEVFRNGMDPFSFVRCLSSLGTVVQLVTLIDAIPPAQEMDPESCYLGFEISFSSAADKVAIDAIFNFVRSDCLIRILPPRSKISEYQRLILDLPEEEMRLGEILVNCGTLTPEELDHILRLQAEHGDEPPRRIGEVLVEQQLVSPPVVEAALEKQKQVKENKKAEANLIRVDADKLDELINLVGELIIAGAGTNLIARRAHMADLTESTATLSRLVEEVRDSALALRMVQIGGTFNRFQRVVRDVSKELGKDVDLVISGGDTELDKTVVEKIGDPLTHLVRNSMDHGIESAELRLARGKPAKGTLKLNAYHDAGSIVIEVSDDGGGLNKEKILSKAIERGLISADVSLTDKEIYKLIFEAGFSTADTVSNLSGRGVGMDVVRRNIQALRGSIDLDSIEGQGSTIRIRLPLTLAIIEGFMVGVGNAAYVIPLDMVVECIELRAWASDEGDGQYLNLRGEVLPYRRLRDHFDSEGDMVQRENVVVVRYGEHKAGLVVDKLMGEFQTVIKPLGKLFKSEKSIGGFTILGSGEVALIVDVPGLMGQIEVEKGTVERAGTVAAR